MRDQSRDRVRTAHATPLDARLERAAGGISAALPGLDPVVAALFLELGVLHLRMDVRAREPYVSESHDAWAFAGASLAARLHAGERVRHRRARARLIDALRRTEEEQGAAAALLADLDAHVEDREVQRSAAR
jgi:hypothetical protein